MSYFRPQQAGNMGLRITSMVLISTSTLSKKPGRVNTTGFNDKVWLDGGGIPHTEKLHITERYHRPDLGHLEIEFTIEDPDTFIKPWVIKRAAELAPTEEIQEYVCTENERDGEHMVGK